MLEEHLSHNEREYRAPHPESAKVVPKSEAVTESAKSRKQAVDHIQIRGEVEEGDLDDLQRVMEKVHVKNNPTSVKAVGLANGFGSR